jgi:hypothetical protein
MWENCSIYPWNVWLETCGFYFSKNKTCGFVILKHSKQWARSTFDTRNVALIHISPLLIYFLLLRNVSFFLDDTLLSQRMSTHSGPVPVSNGKTTWGPHAREKAKATGIWKRVCGRLDTGALLEGARGTWAPVTCLGPIQPSVSTCAARQPLILARAEFLRLFAKKRAEFVRAQLHANSCESFVASHFRPPHFFSENFVV